MNISQYWFFLPLILMGTSQACHENNLDKAQKVVDFEVGVPIRVGPESVNSTFSYYNTTPESPDGNLISYVKVLSPQKDRYDKLSGELWICNADLTAHRKIAQFNNFQVHDGVNAQWIDNNSIAYFIDWKIRVVDINGKEIIQAIPAFSLGHAPHDKKIVYSQISNETNYWTIFEYDIFNLKQTEIANALTFNEIDSHFLIKDIIKISDRKIRHLMYSPDGSKIAFRFDVGNDGENGNHLVTMNKNGGDIHFFGPKPMHYAWYDNSSIMGHDNQINDGFNNDKSARRWSQKAKYIETLAGPGNHLAASTNRDLFASESWYNEYPVVLKVFNKGKTTAFWQDTVCDDGFTVWKLGNHVNPSFSRDGKRLYYHKSLARGKSQAFMVVLP